jgi:hypothetical protein
MTERVRLVAPNGTPLCGPVETVLVTYPALVFRTADGRIELEYTAGAASTHHETSEPLTRDPDGGDNEELVFEDTDGVEWLESQLVPATTADDEAGQDRGSH